jgi:hypothetical protein
LGSLLIEVNRNFALITAFRSSENFIIAFGTDIAGLLIGHPVFSTIFPSVGYGPQTNFLPDREGEIINELAGKIVTFVTAGIPLFVVAISYRAAFTKD